MFYLGNLWEPNMSILEDFLRGFYADPYIYCYVVYRILNGKK